MTSPQNAPHPTNTGEWKKSLLLRSFFYGSAFATAMACASVSAQEVGVDGQGPGGPRAANIGSQLEELGFDPDLVRADLDGLSREERRAALEGLGVIIPERPERDGGRIGEQLDALGLDSDEVRASLEGLDRDDRRAALEDLGVVFPERP